MRDSATILIVEDELISAEYLKETLEDAGYQVLEIVTSGQAAIEISHQKKPDLILMDIMLSDNISGTDAALQIHQNDPECKIIFLTAYAEAEMLEQAARSEAYGYLLKPYRKQEILATICLALSRNEGQKKELSHIIELGGGYSFNTKIHRLCKEEKEVSLSKNALKLIELLSRHKNTTVSYEQICLHIWGEHKSENTLRSLVHRIRAHVDVNLIQNINGVGYKIAVNAS